MRSHQLRKSAPAGSRFGVVFANAVVILAAIGFVQFCNGKGVKMSNSSPLSRCVLSVIGEQPEFKEVKVLGKKGDLSWVSVPYTEAKAVLSEKSSVKLLYVTETDMAASLKDLSDRDVFDAVVKRVAKPEFALYEALDKVAVAATLLLADAFEKKSAAKTEEEKSLLETAVYELQTVVDNSIKPFPNVQTVREELIDAIDKYVQITTWEKEVAASPKPGVASGAIALLQTADCTYAELAECNKAVGTDAFTGVKLTDKSVRVCAVSSGNPIAETWSASQEIPVETWRDYWIVPLTLKQMEVMRPYEFPRVLYFSAAEEGFFNARHTQAQIDVFRSGRLQSGSPEYRDLICYVVNQRLLFTASIGQMLRNDNTHQGVPEVVEKQLWTLYGRELVATASFIQKNQGVVLSGTAMGPLGDDVVALLSLIGAAADALPGQVPIAAVTGKSTGAILSATKQLTSKKK